MPAPVYTTVFSESLSRSASCRIFAVATSSSSWNSEAVSQPGLGVPPWASCNGSLQSHVTSGRRTGPSYPRPCMKSLSVCCRNGVARRRSHNPARASSSSARVRGGALSVAASPSSASISCTSGSAPWRAGPEWRGVDVRSRRSRTRCISSSASPPLVLALERGFWRDAVRSSWSSSCWACSSGATSSGKPSPEKCRDSVKFPRSSIMSMESTTKSLWTAAGADV
mmetsp:Transcript_108787/g.307706  ORF Transcript_108787/g.307706 Transcript_108787/m.307706 type:complete len:225 (+) Transcript_108787:1143-1817(+)